MTTSWAAAEIGTILITGEETDNNNSGGSGFQIGDIAAGEFTGFREVIKKEALLQAGISLAEVVAGESGVQFKQSGGLGSHSSVSLRGSSSEQVNVYLDGILLNEAAGGSVNFSDIELMQAEKIEVYKGAVPVQLGNTAIGGAINITSARVGKTAVTNLLGGIGSFGSSRFSAAFRGPFGWLNEQTLVASFSFRESANDFPFLNDNGTQFNVNDDKQERRRNAQTSSLSGFIKTAHKLGNSLRLEHALQLYEREQGIANWRNTASGNARLYSDNLQWRSTLRKDASTGNWASLWEFTGSKKTELFDDASGSIGNTTQQINSETDVVGVRGYWEKLHENKSFAVSVRLKGETLSTINQLSQINASKARRLRTDISLQQNLNFNESSSLLSATLHGFLVDDDYDIENLEQARDQYSISALVPQIGVSHSLNDRWLLLGNLSRQKRVPTFFELFGEQGLLVGNASLQTETSTNFDLGFRWNSAPAHPVERSLTASYFFNQHNDLIVRTYTAQGVGRSQNLSRANTSGLELQATAEWQQGFSVDATFTLQDSKNRSAISGLTGKQLPGQAAIDSTLKARWKNARWKVEYELRVNTDRYYDSANFLPATDQHLHNIGLSRYWNDWRLDLELNNLTDQNYEDFNGYPKPGRAGFVSLYYEPQSSL